MLKRLAESTGLHVALLSGTIAAVTLTAFRLAVFEPLELRAYDWMLRSRPEHPLDPRILLVTVTEADLQQLNTSTPSDRTVAQVIQKLQQYQPRVIGMDFYRDLPQGEGKSELHRQLQATNVTMIYRIGDQHSDRILPPAGIPAEQLGFNDLPVDHDGVMRRALLFANQDTSFAMQTAFIYLEKQQILPQEHPQHPGILQLGRSTFWPIQPNSGAYRTADTKGHQILLNYRGSHAARRVSLNQVLQQQLNPEWVRDKIVLIGSATISGNDFFYTPYSPGKAQQHKMSGIEVQAQIVSQILDAAMGTRSLIGSCPTWAEWLWTVSWAIVGGIMAWQVRHFVWLSGLQVGLLLLLLGGSWVALNQGLWLPIVAPSVGAIASPMGIIGYRIQRLQRQNRMAMTLLGQNTSASVALALWNHRHTLVQSGKLPGQQATATLLFTDLRGFSGLSEKLPPEALMNWLNEYLTAMTEAVNQFDGIVNKFTGDGLFAVFGVPIPRTHESAIAQDAQNAVRCAIAMSQQLEQLNQRWLSEGLGQFKMRVGICTGAVVVGSLGGKERMEYGVIGDAVNTASRLESCVKERHDDCCRILISESTRQYLGDLVPLEAWGAMELSGKRQQVNVYRVFTASA
jgi:CHASE2 domain-containing sensor protein